MFLLLLHLSPRLCSSKAIYPAPTIRITNSSNPRHVLVHWDPALSAGVAWDTTLTPTIHVEIQTSIENNFLPANTIIFSSPASAESMQIDLPDSTFTSVSYFRMRIANSTTSDGKDWSPTNQKWTVASECDDYLHVEKNDDPTQWLCQVCPEGASCEYANTDMDIKAKFSYQHIEGRLNESFHRCRVKQACLGMRMTEFVPDLYQGRLRKNSSTFELTPVLDLARVNVRPPRCNYELGYMNSVLCERCGTGFVKLTSNRQCEECGSKENKKWLLVGIGTTIMFFLFLMIASRIRSRSRSKTLHSSLKRICITHIQLLAYIMSLNVPWPYFVSFVFYFFTAVSVHVLTGAAAACF